MYTSEQVKQLQHQTKDLLKADTVSVDEIGLLREVLRFHEYRYYVLSDPFLAD